MPIRALIFDFDGLILDTETPEVEVWQAIYAEHGKNLPLELWSQTIGGWGASTFDPAAALQELCPTPIDIVALRSRHRAQSDAIIRSSPMLNGVQEVLADASRLGLRCAIASSSEREWVVPHLTRLGVLHQFELIVTSDDVPTGRTKPHPDLYLKALSILHLAPHEALVLEDSPNGIAAARAAGLRVIGVPNPVTSLLILGPDLLLGSLADMPLEQILGRLNPSGGTDALQSGARTASDHGPLTEYRPG